MKPARRKQLADLEARYDRELLANLRLEGYRRVAKHAAQTRALKRRIDRLETRRRKAEGEDTMTSKITARAIVPEDDYTAALQEALWQAGHRVRGPQTRGVRGRERP